MTSRYIITTQLLSLDDKNTLIDKINNYAFLCTENQAKNYLDIIWTLDEDICNIIDFPANCHIEKIS